MFTAEVAESVRGAIGLVSSASVANCDRRSIRESSNSLSWVSSFWRSWSRLNQRTDSVVFAAMLIYLLIPSSSNPAFLGVQRAKAPALMYSDYQLKRLSP